ncbi:lasso peptide biosynthesis B2 protein [Sphingomonas sp. M1-B02]|uniref:lasso peptide biosynthesis B2 protein n=1 Tax=Sphingomonas sp. M1-B02 TaxID=3114300 RepID=UPI00223ED385|nr:lasso peptide biosynthesis B2 protein [Sphingomonas sp. S6-11]UZK67853.1 lasso peptide biosynthesis B2 protein [Sphingomonas sp. S6-11]
MNDQAEVALPPPPIRAPAMLPRFRIAILDAFHIVLDMQDDRYLAVARDAGACGLADEGALLAETLAASSADIGFAASLHPRFQMPRRDLGVDLGEHPALVDWAALLAALPLSLFQLRIAPPSAWFRGDASAPLRPIGELVAAARRFRSMRPYVPGVRRCLPRSLLLLSYLRVLGLDARLVIGVRLFPFDAHSWVQAGDVVLTDDLEQLSGYAPIVVG